MADANANRRSLISTAAKVFALLSGIGTTAAVLTSAIVTILAESHVFSFLWREYTVWSLSLLAMVVAIGVEFMPGVWRRIKYVLQKKGLFVSHY